MSGPSNNEMKLTRSAIGWAARPLQLISVLCGRREESDSCTFSS
jgi:hypothetical protein